MTAKEFVEKYLPSTPGIAKHILIEKLEKFVYQAADVAFSECNGDHVRGGCAGHRIGRKILEKFEI